MAHQARHSPRLMSNGYYSNVIESDSEGANTDDNGELYRMLSYQSVISNRSKKKIKTRNRSYALTGSSLLANTSNNSANMTRQTIQSVTRVKDGAISSTTRLSSDKLSSTTTTELINDGLYGLENNEDDEILRTHIRAAGDNQNTRRAARLYFQSNEVQRLEEQTSQMDYSNEDDEDSIHDDNKNSPVVNNFPKRSLFRKCLSPVTGFLCICAFLWRKFTQILYQITTGLLVMNTCILRRKMFENRASGSKTSPKFQWRNFLSKFAQFLFYLAKFFSFCLVICWFVIYFQHRWPLNILSGGKRKLEFSPKEPNNNLYLKQLANTVDNSHQVYKLQVEDKLKEFENSMNHLTKNLSVYQKKFADNLELQTEKKLKDEKMSLSLAAEISSKSEYLDKLKKQINLIETNVATAVSEIIQQISEVQTSKIEMESKLSQLEKLQKTNSQFDEKQMKSLIGKEFEEQFSLLLHNPNHLEDKSLSSEHKNLGALLLKIQKEIVVKVKKELNWKVENTNNWLLSSFLTPTVTELQVKGWIREALLNYSADRLGLADYALESSGGSVVNTRCSRGYSYNTGVVKVLGIPFYYSVNTPRSIIQPGVMPGECWAFEGFDGYVVIQLSLPIYISSVTLEHLPRSLSLTNTSSAPKDFSIFGLDSAYDDKGTLLGSFRYEQDHDALQNFPITTPSSESRSFTHVEMRISSNWGHPDFTCIYRLRVHGTPAN